MKMTNLKKLLTATAFGLGLLSAPVGAFADDNAPTNRPTIVLIHGAFAASDSWDGVTDILLADGYPVVSVANPLRSVSGDAAYARAVIDSIDGETVLVGHSYGGMVISAAASGAANVKSLVYVASFAAEPGETVAQLAGQFPGSTLGEALAAPVAIGNGINDLYIDQAKFGQQFAADVPAEKARLMAAAQRPVTDFALNEPAQQAAWKDLPSYHIFGTADKNIPPAAMTFMAERADARKTVVVNDASHVVMVSHPQAVADLIIEAAHPE
ncbi:alpha/beta hydrolase [Thalassospira indica]|uniref:Alpha/beta hydrolase n=2 Tax=Thalassospira indica TaxID=1891279 RepID=A0ABM6Y0Z5_9PROT|nr:alpha/beta hydrolase [Thalassospira indica]